MSRLSVSSSYIALWCGETFPDPERVKELTSAAEVIDLEGCEPPFGDFITQWLGSVLCYVRPDVDQDAEAAFHLIRPETFLWLNASDLAPISVLDASKVSEVDLKALHARIIRCREAKGSLDLARRSLLTQNSNVKQCKEDQVIKEAERILAEERALSSMCNALVAEQF